MNFYGMKDRSTKTKQTFFQDCVFWAIVVMAWYNLVIFQCMPDRTYNESLVVLCGMIAISIFAGTFVLYRIERTSWTTALTVIFPFGIYTIMTCENDVRKNAFSLLAVMAVLAGIYDILLMTRRVRNPKRRKYIYKNRLYKAFIAIQSAAGVGLLIVVMTLGISPILRRIIPGSTIEVMIYNEIEKQTIDSNIDTIMLLQEKEWEHLTTQERLDVLETVVKIETYNLGISNEVKIGAAHLPEQILGYYSKNKCAIYISEEHLENDTAHKVLDICCHEVYHYYEDRMIEAYKISEGSQINILNYNKVTQYAKEFKEYKKVKDDFMMYYSQVCEKDARKYAAEATERYYEAIDEHLKKGWREQEGR